MGFVCKGSILFSGTSNYQRFLQQWLLARHQLRIRFEMDCQPQEFERSPNSSWFLFCFCIYKIKIITFVNIWIDWKKNGTRNCKQLIHSLYFVSVYKTGPNDICFMLTHR